MHTFAIGKCVNLHWKVLRSHLLQTNVLTYTGRCSRAYALEGTHVHMHWCTGRCSHTHLPKANVLNYTEKNSRAQPSAKGAHAQICLRQMCQYNNHEDI